MDLIAGVATIVAAIVAVIAYVRPRSTPGSTAKASSGLVNDKCSESSLVNVISSKTIRVVCFRYPPLIDYEINGNDVNLTGLYGEMLKLIARQEGLSMSFSAINTGDAIGAVENYDTDMALCIFQTSQRSKRVDFSALLHTVKVGGLILSTQSKIRAVGDLQQSSVRIAVCRGEIGHEWVTTVMRIPKRRLTILDTHDNRELAMLVESGKADIALADFITLSQYLELRETRQPAMRMVFRRDPITICSNGIAVARGQEDWANWLDQKFREIQCTPEIQKMETQTLKNYKNIIQRN